MLNLVFSKIFSKKTCHNYNLNYDFSSINIAEKNPTHIVVFTGGKSPDVIQYKKFLKSTLNKAPDFVIAADSGLETLFEYSKSIKSLKPDVILGDMDSIKNKKLISKFNCKIEKFNPYKDFTDTELALILASKLKLKSECNVCNLYNAYIKNNTSTLKNTTVTLIGGSGGRIDHLAAIFDIFSSNIAPDFWLTEEQFLVLLKENGRAKIQPKQKSSPISFFRPFYNLFLKSKNVIKSNGLEWESNLFRNSKVPSLSNEIKADFFSKKMPAEVFTKEPILISVEYSTKVQVM